MREIDVVSGLWVVLVKLSSLANAVACSKFALYFLRCCCCIELCVFVLLRKLVSFGLEADDDAC